MKSKNLLKTYLMNIGKFFTIAAAFVFLTFAASQANAQSLDQCNPDNNPACDWQNGNLKGLSEGDSAPYRFYYSGLTPGDEYTAEISFQATNAGARAQDYLTTYNKTFTQADPCQPTSLCGDNASTFPIPPDPDVTAACPNCAQGGNFTIWGGTITAASDYSLDATKNDYTNNAVRKITITFTASSPNVLIAFGGHISSRVEWGFTTKTCATIQGSPYHVWINGLANRSMKVSEIFFPGLIKVTKAVAGRTTVNGQPSEYTTSPDTFSFASTNNEIAGFTLTDNYDNCTAYTDTFLCAAANVDPLASQYIQPSPAQQGQTSASDWMIFTLNNVASPGASGTISETGDSVSGLSLTDLHCTLGVGSPGTIDTSSLAIVFSGFVQGSSATCTFVNSRAGTTAATAVVTGRVTTTAGKGIKGATVTAHNYKGTTVSVKTDAKGNYEFNGLETNDGYSFSASAKGYTLTATGQSSFFPLGDSQVVDFTGTAAASTKGGKHK